MNNYNCIVDFFKTMDLYDKDYFEKIQEKTTIIKGEKNILKDFIGFYPKYENDELVDFKLYLPELVGLNNILIYIHMYGYVLFPDDESEIFPNILEALFMNTYLMLPNKTEQQIERLDNKIVNTTSNDLRKELSYKVKCLKHLRQSK